MDQFPSDGGHAAGVLKPLPALLRNCFFGDFFFFFLMRSSLSYQMRKKLKTVKTVRKGGSEKQGSEETGSQVKIASQWE